MKIEIIDEMEKRAGTKKDGVYRFKGIPYRVIDGHVMFYVDFRTVCSIEGAFVLERGTFEYEKDAIEFMKKCE